MISRHCIVEICTAQSTYHVVRLLPRFDFALHCLATNAFLKFKRLSVRFRGFSISGFRGFGCSFLCFGLRYCLADNNFGEVGVK